MPNLCANLMYLFTELPPMARFEAAKKAGFDLVEYQFPYDHDATDMRHAMDEAGVRMRLINTPPGDKARGERGLAALADREADFRDGFLLALSYARELGSPLIHVMAGVVPDDERDYATAVYAENLRICASAAEAADVGIVIEPINGIDIPGYLLQRTAQARAMIATVGEANLTLQYDAYHALMNGEDPAEGLRANLDIISHIQIAGFPGRAEPIAGDGYDFGGFIELCDTLGYAGAIGCEYNPKNGTQAGLSWASRYGIAAP
ncbi:MAG: TIM barrel protein [Rhodospirillales bacterium]|nr:TIM barrel protein [Rhodospirillales bacterium]